MRPSPLLLGSLYACSEIILGRLRRSQSVDQTRDRYSLTILWIAIIIGVAGSIVVANELRSALLPYPALGWIGLGLFVTGLVLRWYSIIRLGRFFTVDVTIVAGQKVIDSGPYRFVRHPAYSGALLAFFGFGLALRNWIALPVLLVPIAAAFWWRIRVEEQALGEALGNDYLQYAGRTKRLVPFIW